MKKPTKSELEILSVLREQRTAAVLVVAGLIGLGPRVFGEPDLTFIPPGIKCLEEGQDTWWCTTWGGPFRDARPETCRWLLECNMRILGVDDNVLLRPGVLKGLSDYGINVRVTLPLMGYLIVWQDKRLQDLLRRFPGARSMTRRGDYSYGYLKKDRPSAIFEVADPGQPAFVDFYTAMLKEYYLEQFEREPRLAGFAFMADHPELPGMLYDGGGNPNTREPDGAEYPGGYKYRMGFGLSEDSLRAFVNSPWYEKGAGFDRAGSQSRIRVDRKTGRHGEDGSICPLWEIFIQGSKEYSRDLAPVLWDDLWNHHGGRPPRHGDHAAFLNAMYWTKVREAVDRFNRELGRQAFVWREGGVEFYGLDTPLFGQRKVTAANWYRSAGPGNGSFAPYPDKAISPLRADALPVAGDTRSKLWIEADLGTPGNNGGRITPRQVGYILQYFLPRHPTSVVIWDVNSRLLYNPEHLRYYLPYSRILSRMRYTGDWLGLYHPELRYRTGGTIARRDTQFQWSICGGRGTGNMQEPFLIWISNCGRREDGEFFAADADLRASFDLADFGLSGSWYAFDAATMKVVESGAGGRVELALHVPAWQWRPVYVIPGRLPERGCLYTSAAVCAEDFQGGVLTLHLRGHRGMYYRAVVRTDPPSAVTYRDASGRRALVAVTHLSSILDHCQEGYHYDRSDHCLYVTYQATSGDASVMMDIGL